MWFDDFGDQLSRGVGTNNLELIALRSQLIGVATEVYTWNCNSSELQPKELQSLRIAACWVTKTLSPRSNKCGLLLDNYHYTHITVILSTPRPR
jgi:hypothetical protein